MTVPKPPMSILEDLKPRDGVVRVIPLGGIGEIGMNCYLYEYAGDLLMVDCGQMMPDEQLPGIDYVIPDISYVKARLDRFLGIVLTHAHEDHIGALPYILPQLPKDTPVYGGELTVALLKEKMKEHRLTPHFKQMRGREKFALGKHFIIEPLSVTHSLIDAFGLAIATPVGTIVHSGDYKMDPAPMDGVTFDFAGFGRIADGEDGGALLLMGDSTNADRHGMCPSEATVVPVLRRLIREATGQIIISCFSSSLHRIQTVLNLAAEVGKTVFPAGLNMDRNIRVASALGALEIPCAFEDDLDRLSSVPANKRIIITTGSQGEPMSALSRMSTGTHRAVALQAGDTVILSARLIPGNEKEIYRLIDRLLRRGTKVLFSGNTPGVHVSGHAYRDDMRHLINLTNPRYLVPMHGEYRHLLEHKSLALEAGMEDNEIFIIEDGDCIEVNQSYARVIGKVPHGRIFVDGKGVGDVEMPVLRDRNFLANDGVVTVTMSISRETGEVLCGPYLHTRGFVTEAVESRLMAEAAKVVLDAYGAISDEEKTQVGTVGQTVKKALRQFLGKITDRFPVIIPVIMEI